MGPAACHAIGDDNYGHLLKPRFGGVFFTDECPLLDRGKSTARLQVSMKLEQDQLAAVQASEKFLFLASVYLYASQFGFI